jgi:hypothetical protein
MAADHHEKKPCLSRKPEIETLIALRPAPVDFKQTAVIPRAKLAIPIARIEVSEAGTFASPEITKPLLRTWGVLLGPWSRLKYGNIPTL